MECSDFVSRLFVYLFFLLGTGKLFLNPSILLVYPFFIKLRKYDQQIYFI